ncbi:MAG: glycoside hydrolase family 76 [Chitinophagaceae bacterium]|nr:glycoside hydrolase family 76 [Chitinophagaceae bacterium]
MRNIFFQLVTIAVTSCFLFVQASAQSKYDASGTNLRAAIDRYFYMPDSGYYREHAERRPNDKAVSYLWPLCALIQADREEQALRKENGLLDKTLTIIKKYYDDRPPRAGYASYPPPLGGGDRFYDDNQWVGIAMMDAWADNKNPEYLSLSRGIYDFMMTAWDTVGGGGLYWEEGKPTKNTCSNGPGIILALQLYKATGEKGFLDTAILLYDWVNKNLRDPQGLYLDNIEYPSRKVDQRRYSYNTGTMMQSALYLYGITGNKKYLQEALVSAKSACNYFWGSGTLRDSYWFNAVLLRAYQHLLKHDSDPFYINTFKTCIDAELKNNLQSNGLFKGKRGTLNLVDHGGMLEILNRLALIENK